MISLTEIETRRPNPTRVFRVDGLAGYYQSFVIAAVLQRIRPHYLDALGNERRDMPIVRIDAEPLSNGSWTATVEYLAPTGVAP